MMRNKTHFLKMKELREEWVAELEKQKEYDQRRVDAEYQLALSDIKRDVRAWMVDLNYAVFTADQSLVRARAYAMINQGLGMFHEMAKTKRQG